MLLFFKTNETIITITPLTKGLIMKKFSALMIFFCLFIVVISAKANSCSSQSACSVKSTNNKDIVETAIAAGKFNTLVAAVKAAGLVKALRAKGPLTVFAPTDDAFAKLPKGTVENLLLPENRGKLTEILLYHVVPGKIALGKKKTKTLQGKSLIINATGSLKVNNAKVIAPDIEASNGLIHIIDTVLIPKKETQTPKDAVKKVIELAISRGAPLFNAGQAAACVAVYEVTIESLIKTHTNALTNKERSILQNALNSVRDGKNSSNKQAWILRHALNAVYDALD